MNAKKDKGLVKGLQEAFAEKDAKIAELRAKVDTLSTQCGNHAAEMFRVNRKLENSEAEVEALTVDRDEQK